jgi:hypothetical protein
MYRNVTDIDCILFLTHCGWLSKNCRHAQIDFGKPIIDAQVYTSTYIESVIYSYSVALKSTSTDEIIQREKIDIWKAVFYSDYLIYGWDLVWK